jgi:hypothetical protein
MKRNIFNKSFILISLLLFSLDIYVSGFCRGQETRLVLDGLGGSTFGLLFHYYNSVSLLLIILLVTRLFKNKLWSIILSILILLLTGYLHSKINYFQGVFYGNYPYIEIAGEILLLNTISLYGFILLALIQVVEILSYISGWMKDDAKMRIL